MSELIVVLVTGSRNWRDVETFDTALEMIRKQHPDTTRWVIRHGDCPSGADQLAETWAIAHGVTTDKMPADWAHGGRRAGFVRNQAMVSKDPPPAVCLAFIAQCVKRGCQKPKPHGSHGSVDCSTRAEEAKVATWRWRQGW